LLSLRRSARERKDSALLVVAAMMQLEVNCGDGIKRGALHQHGHQYAPNALVLIPEIIRPFHYEGWPAIKSSTVCQEINRVTRPK